MLAKAGLNRSEGLQIHMSSITTISTIRTHQRHVPETGWQTTNTTICLWQVKTCETSSLVWFPTLWLYVWSLSGWCKAKPTSYFAHLIAEYHEACTHPRNEPPTISVVAIEESQVERENHPQQKKYEEPWPLPNVFQSSKSWKSWTIGPWDPHISRWKDLHPLPGHGH